jgi:hypothetical protein
VNIWSHRSDIHVGPRAAHRHDDAKFLCHTSACPGFDKFLGPPLHGFMSNHRDMGILNLDDNSKDELVSSQLCSKFPTPIWITPDLRNMSCLKNGSVS